MRPCAARGAYAGLCRHKKKSGRECMYPHIDNVIQDRVLQPAGLKSYDLEPPDEVSQKFVIFGGAFWCAACS